MVEFRWNTVAGGPFLAIAFAAQAAVGQSSPTISTYAGTGAVGPSPDGMLASEASLGCLFGTVQCDAAGNVYFSEYTDCWPSEVRIRRIDATSGLLSTVATDTGGEFNVDASGNVYFLEGYQLPGAGYTTGSRIVRVDALTGATSVIAGGVAAVDFFDHAPQLMDGTTVKPISSGDGGLATSAFLREANDLAFDLDGNLLVADSPSLRRIDASTGVITTIAGNRDLVLRYVFPPSSGVWIAGTSMGDGGPALGAGFEILRAITVDAAGNIFAVEHGSFLEGADPDGDAVIRRIDATTGVIERIVGTGNDGYSGDGGPALLADASPWDLATDSAGNLYWSEHWQPVVRRWDATTGLVSVYAGTVSGYGFSGDGGPADQAQLGEIWDVAFGPTGELYLADPDNHRIRRVAPPPNTPVGDDVPVSLATPDGTTVSLLFAHIDGAGETVITEVAVDEGDMPPPGFRFGASGIVYQIDTTATYAGAIHVCLTWVEGRFADESAVQLFHSEDGSTWSNVTDPGYPDESTNEICGTVSSFSWFAILAPFSDADNDGLADDDEWFLGTDPSDPDSDGDGLFDGTEVDIAQGGACPDPLSADSDGDSLSDGTEALVLATDPCNADTDGDGVADATDPLPNVPGVTSGFIEELLRSLSDTVSELPLTEFDGPNDNARKGRRNAIANKLAAAANDVSSGSVEGALSSLESLLQKLDGDPQPPDWMSPGASGSAATALHQDLTLAALLLQLL